MTRIQDAGRAGKLTEVQNDATVKGVDTDALKTDLKSVRGMISREPHLAERDDISDRLDSILDRVGLLQI